MSTPVAESVESPGDHDESGDSRVLTKDEILLQIPAKLDAVEKQLRSSAHNSHRQPPAPSATSHDEEGSSILGHNHQKQEHQWPLPVSAHVAMCNFQQFKTMIHAEDTLCAIEALVWTPTLSSDIDTFMVSLTSPSTRRDIPTEPAKSLNISDAEAVNAFPPDETWIQDVRVNSYAVLSVLDNFCYNEGILIKEPHIFRRPFLYFIQNYDKIKEELQKIESQTRPRTTPMHHPGLPQDVSPSLRDLEKQPETPNDHQGATPGDEGRSGDISRAAEELRCFCDFVKVHIMPKYEQFQNDAFAGTQRIHYDDLEIIFRSGDLIYTPASATQPEEEP
ncbi:hypothetical protein DHEL01_v212855, partial [Diaporthe helianthi]